MPGDHQADSRSRIVGASWQRSWMEWSKELTASGELPRRVSDAAFGAGARYSEVSRSDPAPGAASGSLQPELARQREEDCADIAVIDKSKREMALSVGTTAFDKSTRIPARRQLTTSIRTALTER